MILNKFKEYCFCNIALTWTKLKDTCVSAVSFFVLWSNFIKELSNYIFIFNVSKFSPFALTYEIPVKKSSSSQGSSVWLTETPEPTVTPTPTAEPTQGPTPGVPTVKPTETQTPASPMPILGVLAGLGAAAAVVFGPRRK